MTTVKIKPVETAMWGVKLKVLALKSLAVVAIAILLGNPAVAAGWSVVKNEADPFEPSKSTYIAMTTSGMRGLGIRCLEGTLSLLLVSGPSNASAGDSSELKIVADSSPVREEENAQVIDATTQSTSIQFGDEATLEYLKGTELEGRKQNFDPLHPRRRHGDGLVFRRQVPSQCRDVSPEGLRRRA